MAPTVSDNLLLRSLITSFRVVIDEMGVEKALTVVIPVPAEPVLGAVVLVVTVAVGVGVDDREVDNCAISSCHLVMVVCNPSSSFSTPRMVPCK